MDENREINIFFGIILPINDFVLVVFGGLILLLGIAVCSAIEWLLSNLCTIVAGIGFFFVFIYFIGSVYSYVKDSNTIKRSFDVEEAEGLIISLKKKVLLEARKLLVLTILYAIGWVIVIFVLKCIF
jgi:hypothetical protein